MPVKKIPPLLGINNVKENAALEVGGDAAGLFVRDAVNVDITESGRVRMRQGIAQQSSIAFKYLWQSPLHGDCFAQLGDQWVKVDLSDWSYEVLTEIGAGPVWHIVLNNQVCVSTELGLFTYNGTSAVRLTLDTPAAPQLLSASGGSIAPGKIQAAISWLRNGQESGLSELTSIDLNAQSILNVTFPMCLDSSVTHVRLYLTDLDGGELKQAADYPIENLSASLPLIADLGRAAQFQYLDSMRTGKYLKLWRGRLWVAQSNVLYFSEAMAFHLTDPRYNFIQFPERITFVEPVEGGIWVGQVTHVVFLRGADVRGMSMERKTSKRPVNGGSLFVESEELAQYASGGLGCAMWLAENGLVIGMADGGMVELHGGILQGISADSAHLVRFEQRILALVS